MSTLPSTENLHRHFRLFALEGRSARRMELPVRVNGYNDAMHLVAHLVKTSITALEGIDSVETHIAPEPAVNIIATLALILDLIPYEESEFLDEVFRSLPATAAERPTSNYSTETVYLGSKHSRYFLSHDEALN